MNVGDIAIDLESKYDGRCVVIDSNIGTAKEVRIPELDKTVAEENPRFEDSGVVEVCFEEKLKQINPTWWMSDQDSLIRSVRASDTKTYYYPEERLNYIEEGLIDGTVLQVSGVADPFTYKRGAYSIRVFKPETNVSYEKTDIVSSYSKVTKHISSLDGIKNGLRWIEDNNGVKQGVQVQLPEKDTIQIIKDNNRRNDKETRELINNIKELSDKYMRFEVVRASERGQKNLRNKAVATYKENEYESYVIDEVVSGEYIVDGVYSVDMGVQECTCNKSGECDHIRAVRRYSSQSDVSSLTSEV